MRILRGHEPDSTVWGLAFSPDGTWLASSAGDGIRRWHLATGSDTLLSPSFAPSLAFSPGGERLLCASWSHFQVFDLRADPPAVESMITPDHSPDRVPRAVFGPDGGTLVVTDVQIRLYDLPAGLPRQSWPEPINPTALALHAPAALVATAHAERRPGHGSGRTYDHFVGLWRYPSGEPVRRFTQPTSEVTALAFSPDARWLAGASTATLWVWEVATGAVVLRHRPDSKHFRCVAFSPDGRTLAAAHNDRTVRLYAAGSWAEAETFDWQIGPIVSVCFAPDGMRAAAGSKRGLIVLWDVDP